MTLAMSTRGDVTQLLEELTAGDIKAADRLWPVVYDALRNVAGRYLRHEKEDHTLQPTALVHEVYLRLIGDSEVDWQGRGCFFTVAARAMRRILVDHARRSRAAKRGGNRRRVPLTELADLSHDSHEYLVAIDDALTELASLDPQLSQVVELRFFGGLTIEDTAQSLNISPMTVKRRWRMAKGWLHREITREE